MQITIYTDGACDIHAENRPGGWAAILRATDENGKLLKESVISGGEEQTTNNRMELRAVIEGLRTLSEPAKATLLTDSRYVLDIASGKKKPTRNKALWQEFRAEAHKHAISWSYVAGHSGDELNERCDRLAVAEKLKLARSSGHADEEAVPAILAAYEVYLSTQYSGKAKASAWSAIVLHDSRSAELSGKLVDTREPEAVLIAAIETLKTLPSRQSVAIFTAQEYLAKGMNEWLAGWVKRNWRVKGGQPVKNKARWLALRDLAQGRQAQFVFVKNRAECPWFQRGKALASERLTGA